MSEGLDAAQAEALEKMFAGRNVFLSGTGGTGKSAIIRLFLENCRKNVICVAPTGLAALNLPDAMTIHGFFRFPIDRIMLDADDVPTDDGRLAEVLHHTDCIVIDEISMARADIFNALEISMRVNGGAQDRSFGGKQIIVVGDFLQLPPVITDEAVNTVLHKRFGGIYAFNTEAWKQASFCNVYLSKVHRQSDPWWIACLEKIRLRLPGVKAMLEDHPIPICNTPQKALSLCCRRGEADEINDVEMRKLDTFGNLSFGEVHGIFPEHELPVPMTLVLRIGSRVMVVCNGKRQVMPGRLAYEYVNGEIGTIYAFDDRGEVVCLKMDNGRHIKVKRSRWSNIRYQLGTNEDGETIITSEEIGWYRQFPLLPAWAMSIHKAQGQTLDCRTHIVLGRDGCFAPGQLYTALSRVRNFSDLSVDRPIKYADIIVDSMVLDFLTDTFPDHFDFSQGG